MSCRNEGESGGTRMHEYQRRSSDTLVGVGSRSRIVTSTWFSLGCARTREHYTTEAVRAHLHTCAIHLHPTLHGCNMDIARTRKGNAGTQENVREGSQLAPLDNGFILSAGVQVCSQARDTTKRGGSLLECSIPVVLAHHPGCRTNPFL